MVTKTSSTHRGITMVTQYYLCKVYMLPQATLNIESNGQITTFVYYSISSYEVRYNGWIGITLSSFDDNILHIESLSEALSGKKILFGMLLGYSKL
jgi:hypothetical protein